jgi:hypothetical protein
MLLPLRIRTHISCEEILYEGVCDAVEISMLLILDIIINLTQITGKGGA